MKKMMNNAQEETLARLDQRDPKMKMRWDHDLGAPALLSGELAEPFHGASNQVVVQAALEFLDEHKTLFRMAEPKRDLVLINKVSDAAGNTAVAMQQTYKGVPVRGGTVRVQFTPEKTVSQVSNKYQPDLDIDTDPEVDADQATQTALQAAGQGRPAEGFPPDLSVFQRKGKWHLVWNVRIDDIEHERLLHYFVDAHNGDIVFVYNDFRTFPTTTGRGTGYYSGSGNIPTFQDGSTYKLIDDTRVASGGPEIRICDVNGTQANPSNSNVSEDSNNNWNSTTGARKDHQGPEVDALRYLGETVDYYRNVHNWNSYDNAGSTVYAAIHYGTNYDNAFYWGWTKKFYFGDGSNTINTFDYTTAKDVIAHEFTHGVTDHSSNLDYFDQPGGLNEAFSDIFAAFIDSDDTDIGEECTTPGFPGDCLRRMSNPSDPGAVARIPNHVLAALDTMGVGYEDTVYDANGDIIQGDPHDNCGPVIYAGYFMMHGGTHPNSNVSVQAIGYAKTAKIMFHVQSIGLLGNNGATFLECREAALNAVNSLYKTDPNYLKIMDSVKNAFTAVGIGPDIFVRDSLTDVGTIPSVGTLCMSPDIITRTTQVSNPSTTLGDMARGDLAENVESGQDNWVYVRLQNRGSVAGDVTVKVYWSSPSTFSTPSSWNLVGTAYATNVQPNSVEIVEIKWPAANIPPLGHFCLVSELDDPTDPAPDKTLITTGSMYSKFIAESNNYAWKNINVVDILPAGLTHLEFVIRGGSEDPNPELWFEVQALPSGARAYMRILRRLCEGVLFEGMQFSEANTRYSYYDLNTAQTCKMRGIPFQDGDESEVHLYIETPEDTTDSYEIAVVQQVGGMTTGRITQVLNVLQGQEFDYIGNRNTREVHKADCQWVGRMSKANMKGFRTLEHAHSVGYDNCAYCLGDSKR